MSKFAICYTCDENIPVESIVDDKCPSCGRMASDWFGDLMIVESERRQTDDPT